MQTPLHRDDKNGKTRLAYALDFVKLKIAHRLINPKKTDQVAVVLFGGRTKNDLASDRDGYDNIEQFMAMRQPSYADMLRLDSIDYGNARVDLIAAIYVAGSIVRDAKVARKDASKQVVLLTNADEEATKDEKGAVTVTTAWTDETWLAPLYNAVVPGRDGNPIDWKHLFKLGVM